MLKVVIEMVAKRGKHRWDYWFCEDFKCLYPESEWNVEICKEFIVFNLT